ncbi:MAG: hypothetical protein Q8N63_09165 [Nanoarchaeota archaeon]|nr:hypothetical protein [Nanoarchaeota archaeon]
MKRLMITILITICLVALVVAFVFFMSSDLLPILLISMEMYDKPGCFLSLANLSFRLSPESKNLKKEFIEKARRIPGEISHKTFEINGKEVEIRLFKNSKDFVSLSFLSENCFVDVDTIRGFNIEVLAVSSVQSVDLSDTDTVVDAVKFSLLVLDKLYEDDLISGYHEDSAIRDARKNLR